MFDGMAPTVYLSTSNQCNHTLDAPATLQYTVNIRVAFHTVIDLKGKWLSAPKGPLVTSPQDIPGVRDDKRPITPATNAVDPTINQNNSPVKALAFRWSSKSMSSSFS